MKKFLEFEKQYSKDEKEFIKAQEKTKEILAKRMEQKELTNTYQSPKITVVTFKVEDGFGSIREAGRSDGPINFGGDDEHGLMNHSTGDHSGLGQYQEGGNIFGETIGG